MKNNFLKIFLIALVMLIFGSFFQTTALANNQRQEENDKIIVTYLGVPIGQPIFNVANILPGDCVQREIKIKNKGNQSIVVKVRSDREQDPGNLSTQMTITFKNEFGPELLSGFFNNSKSGNWKELALVPSNTERPYQITTCLDKNTPNQYQHQTVIFDLIFTATENQPEISHLVINEVYYQPDNNRFNYSCHYFHFFKHDYHFGKCDDRGQKDQWVELYNPTGKNIALKNWVLEDNSGSKTKINSNTTIKAGGFVLISKDSDTWKYWDLPRNTIKIELGREIGNGLDKTGDHLILRNPDGVETDKLGWGNDKTIWNPAITSVTPGSSIERITKGFDTDKVTDWHRQTPPTPGN